MVGRVFCEGEDEGVNEEARGGELGTLLSRADGYVVAAEGRRRVLMLRGQLHLWEWDCRVGSLWLGW